MSEIATYYDMLAILKQIGLEEKQAKIYLACLELGETTVVEIARKTGVKRTTVYENITEMISSGIIKTSARGKRKTFLAISPQDLKDLLKKKEELLEQAMPQLMAMSNVGEAKPKVWFYQGKDGVLQAYEDSLNYPDSEVVGWSSGEVVKMFSMKECEQYIAKMIRKKILQRLIVPSDKEMNKFIIENSRQLRQTKVVDFSEYPFKIEINIYASRMAIFSVKDKMAVIIESDAISAAMRMIFRMCWRSLPEK